MNASRYCPKCDRRLPLGFHSTIMVVTTSNFGLVHDIRESKHYHIIRSLQTGFQTHSALPGHSGSRLKLSKYEDYKRVFGLILVRF